MTKLKKIFPQIQENICLKDYSTFKIGGRARYFIAIENKEDLIKLIENIDCPFIVLGSGSNTLISDKDFNGLAIVFKKEKPEILIEDCGEFGIIKVHASTMLSHLVLNLKNYIGLEWAVGIPGTLGGAINGNAGAFEGSISDLIESVEVFEVGKGIKEFKNNDCCFNYRNSVFKNNPNLIILSASLKLKKGNPLDKIKENIKKRKNKYPNNFSVGSIFKNYYGVVDKKILEKYPLIKKFYEKNGYVSAGLLIEECGLKGIRIGDAEISDQHANFIINLQNAKSENILKLINFVKKSVKKKFLIDLEEEIKIF
jgi:UDP-N-acetylmuramate dehydrogenase